MTLEQAFECPRTLSKLRSGPLGRLMEGFCDDLLASGFGRSTVRKHLSNASHLNAYLMTRKGVAGHSLSSQDISEFLCDYPLRARNRGPLDRHIAGVKTAINNASRLHDLRHSFAVHRLLAWYRDGEDINARLPWLATYMGHVDIRSTQVYLHATTDLLEQVNDRFHDHYLQHVTTQGVTP